MANDAEHALFPPRFDRSGTSPRPSEALEDCLSNAKCDAQCAQRTTIHSISSAPDSLLLDFALWTLCVAYTPAYLASTQMNSHDRFFMLHLNNTPSMDHVMLFY